MNEMAHEDNGEDAMGMTWQHVEDRRSGDDRRKSPRATMSRRLADYVDSLDITDPIARANRMIDEALSLQDSGMLAEADEMLDEAYRILSCPHATTADTLPPEPAADPRAHLEQLGRTLGVAR